MECAEENLKVAPPIRFDVARQVRVFEPYIQYVEISMTGCAIQRHRIELPKVIHGIGPPGEIQSRLKTTFELIKKSSQVSSKALEDALRLIREDFTQSLGKPWGRVILRSVRPLFDKRIEDFREKLKAHKEQVESELAKLLEDSQKELIEHFLPMVKKNPPDALLGQLSLKCPNDAIIKNWLDDELKNVFPSVYELISDMRLDVQLRDVTYETVSQPEFAYAIREAYPLVDWKKPFDEFHAAKEHGTK